MLSTADASLVERELALPGLATLLDADALVAALRSSAADLEVETAELTYLRYDPGSSCVAGYRLECQGRSRNAYAKAWSHDREGERRKLLEAAPRGTREREANPLLLLEPAIAICVFPRDIRLHALARLVDPRRRERLVSRLLPDRPELRTVEAEPVRYKPERRYVCRLRSESEGDIALKFYRRRGFAAAKHNAARLSPGELLALPSWAGASDRHRIAAFQWIPGPLLRDTIRSRAGDVTGITRAATALAELHSQDVALPRRSRDDEVSAVRSSARVLEALLPERAARTEALLERIAVLLSNAPARDALIHGDFYAKQVVLNADRAAIIDLDTAARGHPLADIGLFLAHLERDVLLGRMDAGRALEVREGFLESYQQATCSRLPDGVSAYAAAGLVRLSIYPFRIRHPEWPRAVEGLLRRAEALVAT